MRSASPTSICLPFTESCMLCVLLAWGRSSIGFKQIGPTLRRRPYESEAGESSAPPAAVPAMTFSGRRNDTPPRPDRLSQPHRLLAAALHRGWNTQRFPIFGNCPPGDIDAVLLQDLDDALVRQHLAAGLGFDQRLDAEADRLGGMGVAAARGLDR